MLKSKHKYDIIQYAKLRNAPKKGKQIGKIPFFPFVNANFDFLINASISDFTEEKFL
jgi:hypothetical protein